MANPFKAHCPWLGAMVVCGALVTVAPSALAQSTGEQPTNSTEETTRPPAAVLPTATTTDSSGAPVVDANAGFGNTEASQGLFGESSSPFDLIHRAVLMNEMSLSDFSRQHQNRVSREAANFRVMQQEAIRQQAALESAESGEPNAPVAE